MTSWLAVALVGAGVGFLGGAFGKGGSAVATPLLALVGIPPFVAVAAPLPATIPATSIASFAYWRENLMDRRVIAWSVAIGVPATVVGGLASAFVSGSLLVKITEVILAVLGLRLLLRPSPSGPGLASPTEGRTGALATVAGVTGLAGGLLANSGGFLLAPLYIAVLKIPIKKAFACSLAVSAVIAIPGTIVHFALGHIDWAIVAVFGFTSIPLSYLGARVAIRANSTGLERVYGAGLAILAVVLFFTRS